MQNRAVEYQLRDKLKSDTTLMADVDGVYVTKVPRGAKMPFLVLNLIADPNTKTMLSCYGGQAEIQIDIFSRSDSDYTLRSIVKDALRRIRGAAGGLKIIAVRVTGENDLGMEDTGLHRWTISGQAEYEVLGDPVLSSVTYESGTVTYQGEAVYA